MTMATVKDANRTMKKNIASSTGKTERVGSRVTKDPVSQNNEIAC